MLSENEVRQRALYCYCVMLQLGWLHDNELIEPNRYMDILNNSSLQLADDEFLTLTIEESLAMGREDAGLSGILALYEGFVHALCEVLEIGIDDLRKEISPQFLIQLAQEVGVDIKVQPRS